MRRLFALILLAVLSQSCPAVPVFRGAEVWMADSAATRAVVVEGTVKSVDVKAMSFVLASDGKDTVVTVIRETKYKVDGKDAKMEDALKPGAKVKVTHVDAKASLVEVVREKRN